LAKAKFLWAHAKEKAAQLLALNECGGSTAANIT